MKVYHRLVRMLKKKCPPAFPVQVKRIKLSGEDGYCSKIKNKFQIRINRELDECAAINTLLHEWAHARAWSHLHDFLDQKEFSEVAHDASWGVAYSEVYRIFEQCLD